MSWLPRTPVIVPIDFSPASEAAVAVAAELAGEASQVHLLHVLVPLDHASPGVVWGGVSDEQREATVRKRLQAVAAAQGASAAPIAVRIGNAGMEICEYADEIGAALIVIPSHGYHGVQRVLLGSVAERVLRHASCPTLVLRRNNDSA